MELKEKEFPEYSCVSMKANTTVAFRWSAEGWSYNHDHHGHQLLSADPHQGSAKSHRRWARWGRALRRSRLYGWARVYECEKIATTSGNSWGEKNLLRKTWWRHGISSNCCLGPERKAEKSKNRSAIFQDRRNHSYVSLFRKIFWNSVSFYISVWLWTRGPSASVSAHSRALGLQVWITVSQDHALFAVVVREGGLMVCKGSASELFASAIFFSLW